MKDFLISFFLPEGTTDWFDIVRVEEVRFPRAAQLQMLPKHPTHLAEHSPKPMLLQWQTPSTLFHWFLFKRREWAANPIPSM